MIRITEDKKDMISDYTEKILHYAGKMMQCVEALEPEEDGYGERMSYRSMGGMRDAEGYGERGHGRRDEYDYDERRGSRGGSRYR